MVSTNSTSTSRAQIKSRSIGLRRAMCFQQGHGHPGPWRICGRRRSILSMALLSSTSQAGTNTHQIKSLYVITGGSVLLWTVHRVHVGVAVSTSGSPWGPYTDPRGKFSLSFERSLMIVFPEKFHFQASLWWRSPSAWQVQSTHTISGARRSFVDKDIIYDVDILVVVVIDIHIIFNGIIDIDVHVDINTYWYISQLTTQRPIIWASLPPMADGQHVVKRPRGSCHRIHQVAKIVEAFIFQRRRKILKYANYVTIRRLADNGLDFEQVVNSFLKTLEISQILTKNTYKPQNLRIVLLLCFSRVVGTALDLKTGPPRLHGWFSGNFL